MQTTSTNSKHEPSSLPSKPHSTMPSSRAIPLAILLPAQATAQSREQPIPLTFDVASIKPSDPARPGDIMNASVFHAAVPGSAASARGAA